MSEAFGVCWASASVSEAFGVGWASASVSEPHGVGSENGRGSAWSQGGVARWRGRLYTSRFITFILLFEVVDPFGVFKSFLQCIKLIQKKIYLKARIFVHNT